jgi:hypothetical protein
MAKLNFNSNVTPRTPLRAIQDVALNRTIGELEVSEGTNPHLPCYPYKYLPVMVIDNASDEGIVLVKGTIVSLITNQTNLVDGIPASGIPEPITSGNIPITDDATTTAVDWIVGNIDDNYFGYDQSVIGLLVPANGGTASAIPYSSFDTTVATFADSGTQPLNLGANMPVGIVYQDVYQDIRGFNLNYQMHDVYGYASRGFINVPFVDTAAVTTFGSSADTQTATLDTTSCYYKIWRKYAFFYFSHANNGGSAGQILRSDLLGKFIPQGTTATTAVTAQSVGRLHACDSRFPKDLVATTQTYPGSKVTGTDTFGLPSVLYHFAKAVLESDGTARTNLQILTDVQNGNFGLARIGLIL